MGSLIFTIAPSTVFKASNTRVNKNLKAAPWDKTLILFNSSCVSFLTDVYPSIKFFAFVTLKLRSFFRPSKQRALKQIAISNAKKSSHEK